MTKVTGRLAEKHNKFHIVVSYYVDGKRKQRWKSTGYVVKGNKRKAEEMIKPFTIEIENELKILEKNKISKNNSEDTIEFVTFLEKWLRIIKYNIEETSYGGYQSLIKSKISEYFTPLDISIKDLTAMQIQDFYNYLLDNGISGTTVHRYHAIIRKSLNYAVKMDMIISNPALKVDLPKKNKFIPSFYSANEFEQLLNSVADTVFELPILLAVFYGLRRGEVLGLKLDAVDFDNKTLSIRHTVTESTIDNKRKVIFKDTPKTKSSYRTFPLVEVVETAILKSRNLQSDYKKLCGTSYCTKYKNYLCKNEFGEIIKPGYLSKKYKKILAANNLRIIRFHDLRHTCASLLFAEDVSLKDIQEWLGHSTLSTTADIYVHLDSKRKISSANKLANKLNLEIFGATN